MTAKFIQVNAALTSSEYKFLIKLLGASGDRLAKNVLTKVSTADDVVEITCYRQTEKMNRSSAIAFYQECADNSDGCERERYMNILDGLRRGCTKVSD